MTANRGPAQPATPDIFARPKLAEALRAYAAERGGPVRTGATYRLGDVAPAGAVEAIARCDRCGNILTIADRGAKCRQCYRAQSFGLDK